VFQWGQGTCFCLLGLRAAWVCCAIPRGQVALRSAAAIIAVVALLTGVFRMEAGLYSTPTASVAASNAFLVIGCGELLAAVLLVTSVWVSFLASVNGSPANLRRLNVLGGTLLAITSAISGALYSGSVVFIDIKLPVVVTMSVLEICTGGFYLLKARSFTSTLDGIAGDVSEEAAHRIRQVIRRVRLVGVLIFGMLGTTIFMGLELVTKYPLIYAFGFFLAFAVRWALAAATLQLAMPPGKSSIQPHRKVTGRSQRLVLTTDVGASNVGDRDRDRDLLSTQASLAAGLRLGGSPARTEQ
jgi:hypothetical protein